MGIFYGDIHYGIKISKNIENNDQIFEEPIYEIKFDNKSISLKEYLSNIRVIFSYLLKPENYKYKLFVDITTTHNNSNEQNKGWQIITEKQMFNFVNGMYKIDYLEL